jgi:outer membrane receptor for ferrienterochelin and colicins
MIDKPCFIKTFAPDMKTFLCRAILGMLLMQATSICMAQDSIPSFLKKDLQEVVVTANRGERKLGNVAVPVTIIDKKTIERAGSLRLKDILQEQTGLFITAGFGAGVQMQGLSSSYTMIMIDGEPLVGRTAGTLDINRITVGNIKKIEIIKGPSSSLYGSEALAGVINIITDKSYQQKWNAGLRYGTYNTTDANVGYSDRIGKLGISIHSNAYYTDGYSVRPNTVDRAKLPILRLTQQMNFQYPISAKTQATLGLRYNFEQIKNELGVENNGALVVSKGREQNHDWNLTPTILHQFNDRVKTAVRVYATSFTGEQTLDVVNEKDYRDYQRHRFFRVEDQTDWKVASTLHVTAGLGYTKESLNSTRYDDVENEKTNNAWYGFTQVEYTPTDWLTVVGGLRYDGNQLYASACSPKLAVRASVSEKFILNASMGRGFKAPDFRTLYLNFTNTAAGGYSVYGTIDAVRIISELNRLGQIAQLEDDFYRLSDLQPETSTGINLGFTWYPANPVKWTVNVFRNDIENLIDSRLVALRKVDNNGATSQIFSYLNVANAYTQGVETELNFQLNQHISIQGGYQLLLSADKDELSRISAGKVYTRDENGFSRLMKRSEYIGLPNRSRHMANLKVQYEQEGGFFANVRVLYRSKWAIGDRDGNGMYNDQDEFGQGFPLVNFSTGKSFSKGWRVQAGCDNIFGYEDAMYLPNMPGRSFYIGVNYQYVQSNKRK